MKWKKDYSEAAAEKRRLLELSSARASRRVILNASRKARHEVRKLQVPLQLGRVPVRVPLGVRLFQTHQTMKMTSMRSFADFEVEPDELSVMLRQFLLKNHGP